MTIFRNLYFFLQISLFLFLAPKTIGMSLSEAFDKQINENNNEQPIDILKLHTDMNRYNQYIQKNPTQKALKSFKKNYQLPWNAIFNTMNCDVNSDSDVYSNMSRSAEKFALASYVMRHFDLGDYAVINFCAIFADCVKNGDISRGDEFFQAIDNHAYKHQQGTFEHESISYQIPYVSKVVLSLQDKIDNLEQSDSKNRLSFLKDTIITIFFNGESSNENICSIFTGKNENSYNSIIIEFMNKNGYSIDNINLVFEKNLFQRSRFPSIVESSIKNNYDSIERYAEAFKTNFKSSGLSIEDLQNFQPIYEVLMKFKERYEEFLKVETDQYEEDKQKQESRHLQSIKNKLWLKRISWGVLLAAIVGIGGSVWYKYYRPGKK